MSQLWKCLYEHHGPVFFFFFAAELLLKALLLGNSEFWIGDDHYSTIGLSYQSVTLGLTVNRLTVLQLQSQAMYTSDAPMIFQRIRSTTYILHAGTTGTTGTLPIASNQTMVIYSPYIPHLVWWFVQLYSGFHIFLAMFGDTDGF